MIPYRTRERGEGQIGCVLTLLVLIAAGALAVKVMPVYYSDYNLQDFAGELATKAGIFPIPALELQMRDKARELEIPEAMAKGAITITTAGEKSAGSCTITLHYARTVDLYGITPMVISTQKTFTRAYMDVR
jgi:hypothetical protein